MQAKLWIVAIFFAALLAGCSRNPQVAKKNFFDRGSSYFQQGKFHEAAIEYQNAIQIDPSYAAAHYELAQCFLKQSDWALAFQELTRTVAIEPTNGKAQLDLGNLLLAGGKYAEARDRAQIVLAGDPRNAAAQMLLADSDAAQGNLAAAMDEANQAIQMDPKRTQSYINIALIQEKKKDLAAAEKSLQQALSIDPKSMPAFMSLAALYEHQARWLDAEKQYQAAISADLNNPLPRAGLSLLYLRQGKKDAAEQTLKDTKTALKDNRAAYRMLGDFYISQRQIDKALSEFQSLHSEHPQDAGVSKTCAQLLLDSNRVDDAAKIVEVLLKEKPSDPDTLILHGEILSRQKKEAEAIAPLEKAVKAAPNNAAGHYYLGVAYAVTSNLGQAESEWREAARLQPRMIEPQRALATAAMQEGDMKSLAEASRKWIDLDPRAADAYLFRARVLFNKKDLSGAEADLKKSIELAPQNPAGYARFGDLRVFEKRYDDAEKFYSQALALNPSAIDALTGLVNIDFIRKQPAKAIARVEAQIAKVPDSSAFYVLLGLARRQNRNLPKAEEALQKAVDLDRKNVTAILLLADTQVSRRMIDDAVLTYQRAIPDNPKNVRIYTALGGLFESKGQWEQAEDDYKKAIEIQPEYPEAANNLAYLMLEHGGDIGAALKLAQTGRRGLPNLANTADTLGWAYYRFGAYDSAVDSLRDAVKASPKNSTYHYHLGLAYKAAAKPEAAKQELQLTLKLSPNFSEADEIKKTLGELNQKN